MRDDDLQKPFSTHNNLRLVIKTDQIITTSANEILISTLSGGGGGGGRGILNYTNFLLRKSSHYHILETRPLTDEFFGH